MTGLDFSPTAIATARDLAAHVGLADRARFVEADVCSVVHALGGQRFDIVYTGLGALVWLPDLTRWANEVASCLRDGGVFYLLEFHPLAQTLDDDGRTLAHDYFDADPQVCDSSVTYTDGPPLDHTTSVQWQHTLAEIITSLAQAGLRIETLREHPTTLFPRYPELERGQDGAYRFPSGRPRIPLMYSLRAVRS